MNVLMVAAENDAIPGGKVGGIGDVVRDAPYALAEAGHNVAVIMPGYGRFSQLPGARYVTEFQVYFAGQEETVQLFKYTPDDLPHSVTQWILEHPRFAPHGVGKIYCDDGHDQPFATDATKFAFFSAAVSTAIVLHRVDWPDVLHLHDWHAAMIALLREYDNQFHALKSIHTVYTIHNLALQGIRPLSDHHSSVAAWFPGLPYLRSQICDPHNQHCINPMRAGINLANKVHAVSPNYANEIVRPSDYSRGFFGGEGLDHDLRHAAYQDRLKGILNGCEYHNNDKVKMSKAKLIDIMKQSMLTWVGKQPQLRSADFIASQRLDSWAKKRKKDAFVVSSIGRLTDQKVLLLRQMTPSGKSALENLVNIIAESDGVLIILGSGDPNLENFITEVAGRCPNLMFFNGYSDAMSQAVYHYSDLFLMPSSFEPCGISQMLALRSGQPCLAHKVGGLADTIFEGENGFVFDGEGLDEQAQNMQKSLKRAISTMLNEPKEWQRLSDNAYDSRYTWKLSIEQYIEQLYR